MPILPKKRINSLIRKINISPFKSYINKSIHSQVNLDKSSPLHSTLIFTKNPFQIVSSLLQKHQHIDQISQIHAYLITSGLIHNLPIASKLIASFASLPLRGTTNLARSIACQSNGLDTYTWNTIIRGFLEETNPIEAIRVYSRLRSEGLNVDGYTVLFVIKACGLLPVIDFDGKQIHGQIVKLGFESEIIIQTALVKMYAFCDNINYAHQVFEETPKRDRVMWNSLIAAYSQLNYDSKALDLIRIMVSDHNIRPNGVTIVSILSSCSNMRALREGKAVHGYVVRNLTHNDVLVDNALVNFYSKCCSLLVARTIFNSISVKNVISWTSIVNGFNDNGYPIEALNLFKEMVASKLIPDEITKLGVILICSKLGSFELASWIDDYIRKNNGLGLKERITMSNALIDMHARCGNIKRACEIFDNMKDKSLVSWSTMINGLAQHGYGLAALVRFFQMQREGFKPDGIIFLSVLSACSHAGFINEGRKCFDSMIQDFAIEPWMEHYGCMVDLFCRAGLIDEAFEFIGNLPVRPDMIVWRMMLGACESKGDMAKCFIEIMESSKDSGDYGMLLNLHASKGEWESVEEIRKEMRVRGVKKEEPGFSVVTS